MGEDGSPYAELRGRRAFVTGAAQGIGRAIAAALSRRGVAVAIADIDSEAASRAAAEIGKGAVAVEIDVRRRDSVERAFAQALAQLGGCDILIANAGVSTMQHALQLTDEEWDFNFAVNARGVVLTNQIGARHFVAQGAGCIVNTASLAAKVGRRCWRIIRPRNSPFSAGRRRWRASLRPRASASTRSVPALSTPACNRAKSSGRRACA